MEEQGVPYPPILSPSLSSSLPLPFLRSRPPKIQLEGLGSAVNLGSAVSSPSGVILVLKYDIWWQQS